MATVLELLQDAATDLSLTTPPDISDTLDDLTTRRLLRQFHATCRRLAGEHDWSFLRREHTFTTIASATQTSGLPGDFLRFVPETMYNRTSRTRVSGPLTADEWQASQAVVSTYVYDQFMIRGTAFLMTPTPPADETIAYEYITNAIGTDAAGTTARTAFTADDDEAYFDDELLILGTVWRYRKSEGLDYSEEFAEYERLKYDRIKLDGGRRILDMAEGRATMRVPVPPRVPDTLEF